VPASTDDVFICTGPANQPTLAGSTTIDDLLVDAGAALSITSGTLTASGNLTAGNTITGGMVFMTGVGKTVRGTISNLTVAGSVSATAALNVMGNLRITGTGSNLTINGQQVTVTGEFQTDNNAVFTMNNAADLLVVGGNISLSGASTDGKLMAGELRVAGGFLTGNVAAFIATGAHKTVLNGNTAQTVSILNPGPSAERFLNLDITNTAGVTFATMVHVSGSLSVLSAVALNGPFGFTVIGDLSTVVGSSVSVAMVRLQGALGTTGVLGSFSPGTTEFLGSAQPIKGGLSYQHVTIRGTAQPNGPTAMSGDLTIRGLGANLTINGQQVTVTGALSVDNIAALTMTNAADLLVIGGAASFSGLATDVNLTAGELRIGGNLSANIGRFVATGSHRTILNGTAAQTVLLDNSSLTGNRFFNLNITNTAGVTFAANNFAYIGNSLDLTGQMTVSGNATVSVENTLFLRSTSVLNNNGTIFKGACVKEAGATVNGTNPCP
jgi:nucleotide-binding universal stress UspA family protein